MRKNAPADASPGGRLDSALSRVTTGQIHAELPDARDDPKSLYTGRSLYQMVEGQTGGAGRQPGQGSLPQGSVSQGLLPGGSGPNDGADQGNSASLPQGSGGGNLGGGTPGGGASTPPGLEAFTVQAGGDKYTLLPPGLILIIRLYNRRLMCLPGPTLRRSRNG